MKRVSSVLLLLFLTTSVLSNIDVKAEEPTLISIETSTIPQPSYRVTIPERIAFGELSQSIDVVSQPISVSASGISHLYANQKKLIVQVVSKQEFQLIDETKKYNLPYAIYKNETQGLVEDGIFLEITGTKNMDENLSMTVNGVAKLETSKMKKAGVYSDTLIFTLSLQEVNAS